MPTPTRHPPKKPPSPNPRHPFPQFRDEFAPRGWSIFATNTDCGVLMAWGVLCANLPAQCVDAHGLREYIHAMPEEFAGSLRVAADDVEDHAQRCGACSRVLPVALRRASNQ